MTPASTKVLIQCTQLSKLWGVTWAASLTRKVRVSDDLSSARESGDSTFSLRSMLYWLCRLLLEP